MRSYNTDKPSSQYNIVDGVVASLSPLLMTSPNMKCDVQVFVTNATTFTSPITGVIEEVKLAFNAETQPIFLVHVGSGGLGTDVNKHDRSETPLDHSTTYNYVSVESGIEKDSAMAWTTWDSESIEDCTNSYLDQPAIDKNLDTIAMSIPKQSENIEGDQGGT
jgi:hypothetical protein